MAPAMHARLLSFLTAIETALAPADRRPGAWCTTRTVNFHRGLARLSVMAGAGERRRPLGSIQVQAYRLADDSACLRAVLAWSGHETPAVHTLGARPGLDWDDQARRLAAAWQEGLTTAAPAANAVAPMLASG